VASVISTLTVLYGGFVWVGHLTGSFGGVGARRRHAETSAAARALVFGTDPARRRAPAVSGPLLPIAGLSDSMNATMGGAMLPPAEDGRAKRRGQGKQLRATLGAARANTGHRPAAQRPARRSRCRAGRARWTRGAGAVAGEGGCGTQGR
jgi:hypothetical protein